MKAIVLCGGLGTRLGTLTLNTPKPMLEVAGRPFISFILDKLSVSGIDSVVLAAGFAAEKLQNFTGSNWKNTSLHYSIEQTPLGTGGAILLAMQNYNLSEALVINGDTFFDIDLISFICSANKIFSSAKNTILALKSVDDCSRYGSVKIDKEGIIKSFGEKGFSGPGLINGGIYIQQRKILEKFGNSPFSFESDYLATEYLNFDIIGLPSNGYFIDIGVPSDLVKANTEMVSTFQLTL